MQTLSPRPTHAAVALRRLSRPPTKLTQERLAAELGTTQQNVSNWQIGRFRPGSLMRAKIERLYAIPQDAWLTAEERESLASAVPSVDFAQPMRAQGGVR